MSTDELEFRLFCMENDRHCAIAAIRGLDHDLDHERTMLADGRSYDLKELDREGLETLLLIAYDELEHVLMQVHKTAERVAEYERDLDL